MMTQTAMSKTNKHFAFVLFTVKLNVSLFLISYVMYLPPEILFTILNQAE